MSTYEDHVNSLADEAREEYWHECYDAEMHRQLGHLTDSKPFPKLKGEFAKNARAYANAMLVALDEQNREMESDWRD